MNISDEDLQRLKQVELGILDEFLRICNANNIKYFLVGGTLLGAVRHGGFIPWDDDIDISMIRSEYDRFIEACKTQLSSEYALQCFDTEANCGLVFAKIRKNGTVMSEDYSSHIAMNQGIWIDVFVYDAVPAGLKARQRHLRKVSFLKNLYIVKCGYKMPPGKSVVFKCVYFAAKAIAAPLTLDSIISKLKSAFYKYADDPTAKYFPFGGAYAAEKELQDLDYLNNLSPIEFEGRRCLSFANPGEYLSRLYGDYMKLPPVEKRVAGVHRLDKLDFGEK